MTIVSLCIGTARKPVEVVQGRGICRRCGKWAGLRANGSLRAHHAVNSGMPLGGGLTVARVDRTGSQQRDFSDYDCPAAIVPKPLCHCGEPVRYGFDGDPYHHRGMCIDCDLVRCDAYPGECGR